MNIRNSETCDKIVAVSSYCWKPRRLVSGFLVLSYLLFFLPSIAGAASLTKMTAVETKDKLRLVLEINGPARYTVSKGNSYTVITIPGLAWRASAPRSVKSRILESLNIDEQNGICEITAQFKYLTSSSITKLKDPNRIVIDFRKLSRMTIPKLAVPEIEKIYTKSLPEKFKIVINLTGFVPYVVSTVEGGLMIELPNTNSAEKNRKIETKDKLIPRVGIDQVGSSTMISISRNYPSFYQIYKLENPARLIVEFDRASRSTIAAKDISAALRYVKLIRGTEQGQVIINGLIADQHTLNVYPYIAQKKDEAPGLFDIIGSVFTFWSKEEQTKRRRDKVSSMVRDTEALAGVNGAFFGIDGEPLGVLMINGELISYSINDRTALIIDRNNRCLIDNVSLSGESSIEGVTIQLSGINKKRESGEAIVFTPRFGSQTDEDSPGFELSVSGDEVRDIRRAHAWIPNEGYVLSLDASYYDVLGSKVKVGTRIRTALKLIPLSGIPNLEIKHVIGGGPRLLKSGQVYISRNSEQFKSDIAKSRAARTAVGINKEGNLVFATVDKCLPAAGRAGSAGATLEELALIMKDLGCVDAMNLDGGSSSTMVLKDQVINVPSGGAEKAVGSGILIGK